MPNQMLFDHQYDEFYQYFEQIYNEIGSSSEDDKNFTNTSPTQTNT